MYFQGTFLLPLIVFKFLLRTYLSVADSPTKTPLTPTNSLAPPTPAPTTPALQQQSSAITPDVVILEQIRQQFQNQMQLQEHFNNLVAQQQRVKQESRDELLHRHGFR